MQNLCGNTYQIPVSPQNVKWILAQSEGEIVFDHACDLGFHSSALLNGPGALGARGARCRVLLKGEGKKNNWRQPPCVFQPRCPAVEGQRHVPTMYGSASCRVSAIKSNHRKSQKF